MHILYFQMYINTTDITQNTQLKLIKTIMAYLINEDCIACGSCISECPVEAIFEGDIYTIDLEKCTECGTCADVCPTGAISEQEKEENEIEISQLQPKEEMLLYLTLDGKIKVIPVFKDEKGNLIQVDNTNNEKGELTKEKELEIYFINKKKQKYEEKAEELEYLLSREYIKENELQKFFERNPEFILDGEYSEAIPQVILKKEENDKKSIPDFILKPNENIPVPAKIVELKLPNVEIIHNYTRAEAFTQKINLAVGQLRKYYRYFMSDENRKKFLEKYHFQVFCPRLALIVGKDIVDIDKETLNDLKTTFNGIDIITYNEVLAMYRQKIKHLFK